MIENTKNSDCLQRDSAEHKGHARVSRSFNLIWKERDSATPELLEKILERNNLNRAFKRVRTNKGAPGVDGMTIDEAKTFLKENKKEFLDRIYRGKLTPSPVRRVEIPKPDGGNRKLGIPTVIDRTIQQAITQQLTPIYEPLFSDSSYGYRPGRSAKDAILKIKDYAEQGYTYAVILDLSKYFDAKSKRASERILKTSTKFLEKNLKLKVNQEKSRTVSVFALRNFKFLGFALGRNGDGIFIRVHGKSWKKMRRKLKELSSRRRVQSVIPALKKIEIYMRGWLNYYAVASMKNNIDKLNKWLYHRIRMCIWKMWRRPRSKMKYLMKLGVPMELAYMAANSRRGYWRTSNTIAVKMALTKERLIDKGYYDLSNAYQFMHINY